MAASPPDPVALLEHRLRNLLGVIRTQLEVVEAVDTDEARRAALDYIVQAADKAEAELVRLRDALRGQGEG